MSKHDDPNYFGRAVIDGIPQFFSVTGLEKGDIRSGGCLQKWHRRYVLGIKDEDSKSAAAGKKMHDELAFYETHPGAPVMLSAVAMKGLAFVPDPGLDLIVEQTLSSPKNPQLFADGIPVITKMDLVHDRATNKGAQDVNETIDPPGTIEVIDWKWKGDGKKTEYQLQPEELIRTIQMSGYGVTVGNLWPDRERVRLSHVYFFAKNGTARKVTKLHVIDDARRSWEYVDTLARTLRQVAREPNPDNVTPNRFACDRYGGCPYRADCRAYGKNVEQLTMAKLYGETAAKEIKMGLQLPPGLIPQPQQAQQPAQPQYVQQLPAQPQQVQQQLQQEEAQLRAQAAQTQAGTHPGFPEACAAIERSGRGFPMLAGRAAQLKAAMGGYQMTPGAGLAGSGELGGIMMDDPAMIVQLGNELLQEEQRKIQNAQQAALQQAPQQIQLPQNTQPQQLPGFSSTYLPPDAPQNNPALAAKPIEGFPMAGVVMQQPVAQIQLQPQQPVQMVTQEVVQQAQPTAPKRGRRTKAEMEAARAAAAPAGVAPVVTGQTIPMQQPAQQPQAVNTNDAELPFDADSAVYVNCIPNGDFESLHPYIDSICDALVKRFASGPEALKDVRSCDPKGPLGFGGWRGGIRAIVLEIPPPAGNWYIDARNNELASEVANAMLTVCTRTGAHYVKGN